MKIITFILGALLGSPFGLVVGFMSAFGALAMLIVFQKITDSHQLPSQDNVGSSTYDGMSNDDSFHTSPDEPFDWDDEDMANPATGLMMNDDFGGTDAAGNLFGIDNFHCFDDDSSIDINPATGLIMIGGIGGFDMAGNLYGMNNSDLLHDVDDISGPISGVGDDTFSSGINSSIDDESSLSDNFGSGYDDDPFT